MSSEVAICMSPISRGIIIGVPLAGIIGWLCIIGGVELPIQVEEACGPIGGGRRIMSVEEPSPQSGRVEVADQSSRRGGGGIGRIEPSSLVVAIISEGGVEEASPRGGPG